MKEKVYKTARWKKIRQAVIDRDKDICYFCHRLILKRRTIHHLQELNEENWNDEEIAYNLDNLVECHDDCHNIWHERWGYKASVVNADLTIDYSKRR